MTLRWLFCAIALVAVAPVAGTATQPTSDDRPTGAVAPLSPEDGGPRRWQASNAGGLRLLDAPSNNGAEVSNVADGTVLSNMGCTHAEDQVWCDVRPIRGGARGFALAEHLVPATGPNGTVPTGADDSRRRARAGKFDARGDVFCAQERGQELEPCKAAVARGDGGDATVVVTFPNGFKRTLFFVHGQFISASATMSGVGRDTDWRAENGQHFIRVDDQQYEMTGAFIFGD